MCTAAITELARPVRSTYVTVPHTPSTVTAFLHTHSAKIKDPNPSYRIERGTDMGDRDRLATDSQLSFVQ